MPPGGGFLSGNRRAAVRALGALGVACAAAGKQTP